MRRGEPAGAAGQALGVREPLLGALVGPGIASRSAATLAASGSAWSSAVDSSDRDPSIGNAWGRVSPSVLAAIEERLRLLLGLA